MADAPPAPAARTPEPTWFCNKCGKVGEAATRARAEKQHAIVSPRCGYLPAWIENKPAETPPENEALERVCSAALAYAEETVQDENEAEWIRRAVTRMKDDRGELVWLRAKLDELAGYCSADTSRLDWLQLQLYNARDGSIGDVALFGNFGPTIAVQVGANPPLVDAEGATLRHAIDAARRHALARPHAMTSAALTAERAAKEQAEALLRRVEWKLSAIAACAEDSDVFGAVEDAARWANDARDMIESHFARATLTGGGQ